MLIIPAILSNDPAEIRVLLEKCETAGVERAQIDVIDNKFADNLTVDPLILKQIHTFINLDFHLMVKGPIDWIDHCLQGPKTRIIGQIEYMENQADFIRKIKENGSLAGLALDLNTPPDKLDQNALKDVDVVLLMSVPAGFGGQEFDMAVWEKVDIVAQLRSSLNLNFKILIDGGVTKELVNQMQKSGVDEAAVGRRIFEPDLKENLEVFNG